MGQKFSKNQGQRLGEFLFPVMKELFRCLVPGGFLCSFSYPRLYHHMAMSCENCGFEIREQIAWHFTKKSQFKGFKMDHFIRRMDLDSQEKEKLIKSMDGRVTPQLRSEHESILVGQKPKEGTFVNNWIRHGVGLMKGRMDGKCPANVLHYEKDKKEDDNPHLTPKPVDLCKYLIKLYSKEGQTVLDPFMGSGTTLLACKQTKRSGIGIEIDSNYIKVAQRRLANG